MRFLDLDTRYMGYVEYDENVGESIKKEESFMQLFPSSSAAQEISTCVQNLIQDKEHKVWLYNDTYKGRKDKIPENTWTGFRCNLCRDQTGL